MTGKVVAIDGPAGAGKTSIARAVASHFHFALLDTGALYRAVALGALRAGIAWEDAPPLRQFVQDLVQRGLLTLLPAGDALSVRLDGDDVADAIRTPEISRGASCVSAVPSVRQALLPLQRRLVEDGVSVVAEGRDIGTIVFPDADAKLFVTASTETRAQRRYRELLEKSVTTTFEATLREIVERDQRDEQRAIAPLKPASDAILIDTSHVDLQGAIEQCLTAIDQKWAR
jgi:cytidylate kinase